MRERSVGEDVALVTGASRGIGRAIALNWRGAVPPSSARRRAKPGAQGITQWLAADGFKGRGMVLDVAPQASIDALSRTSTRRRCADDSGEQRRDHARQPLPSHEGGGVEQTRQHESGLGFDSRRVCFEA